ncbi:hypothetical protein LTR99_009090 [Exophiala xenobiotica]|uniref:Uncharacterized protein n=1 Tax=Vermiconidia calcicola TaxID=1690605 RepID=A0AAV9PZW1_9PEZI|nr:hypothetical protein LTR99_009090 [Exophiala xenobiotica]KAK5532356.1 hypothetical protein LTR25_007889 [Vermiconidia calcicola]KAK5541894.1 hypothetical protein LTR23_005496 [Chaetothyriales sp. CCFEE 6169]KAK5430025.1 hypothetical protein LTR34_006726 [Exophiala xenobiotica]KAK5447603.1 hypothetical protein LTR18_003184 [Exophiala xenobiotica]
MAQAMDAHSSFVHLVDNIPVWKQTIESLSTHATRKHDQFVADFSRLVNQVQPKRRKSASVASIHTNDEEETQEDETDVPSLPDRVEINPLEAGNRYLYAQATKNRKSGTSIRSGASGPQKFRNKNQVVVYYDSYLQDQLDALVKSIGVGRNNLRKGKNSFVVERGFRLPTPKGGSQGYPSLDNFRNNMMSRTTSPILSGKKAVESIAMTVSDNDEAAFLQVDKELESIQSLCETAAHQFLRDGDCKAELDNIQYKLGAVLAQATSTAGSLKKLKEKQESEEKGQTSDTESQADRPNEPPICPMPKGSSIIQTTYNINNTLEDMRARGAFFSAPAAIVDDPDEGLAADDIEVDDASEQSSIIVDISQYRLANPRRTRV